MYVSLACPWAHRTLIARRLLGLEEAIGSTAVDPVRDDRGWAFREGDGYSADPVNGFAFLSEAYRASTSEFRGRVTVPVLWDKERGRIVNNSEDDLCRMFAGAFAGLGQPNEGADLFPSEISEEQDRLNAIVYEKINNGVYAAGFATTQPAYERAARALFEALDDMEERLEGRRFLFGDEPVETDWRLFCTLIRFDAVYHGHFKCNVRRIAEYPRLQPYLERLYNWPGVAETVNLDHIKRHYYVTHGEINPSQIVPIGPELEWLRT